MSSNDYRMPDLASVLKTLASLAPQSQQQHTQQATLETQVPPHADAPPHPQVWQSQAQQARALSSSSTLVKDTNIIDPTTIIDWSSGLKCVMRTVAKHESMLQDIRRMIKVQHENEEAWWKGRQALIERQNARVEGQKKLDAVLKLVGGTASTGTSNASPEEMAKEIETFDMKVYKAQIQMIKEFTTKLRSLGVPFFGTKTELVKIVGRQVKEDGNGGPKDEKGMIDEAELVKLQRRMLAILEDLCSD